MKSIRTGKENNFENQNFAFILFKAAYLAKVYPKTKNGIGFAKNKTGELGTKKC